MNRRLVELWNGRVKAGDTVYHLGDFAAGGDARFALEIFQALNGNKHLIRGNHDHSGRMRKLLWGSVHALHTIHVGDTTVVLCHYALRVWDRAHYGALHLYGHSHGNLPGDTQSCDVGVDCFDYQPVTLDEIMIRMRSHTARRWGDHHRPKEGSNGA